MAAVEVQKIIAEENLLDNCVKQGEYLKELLEDRLLDQTSPAAPFVFDIRGRGGFWGIEFDIPPEKDFGRNMKLKKRFGALLQTKTMEKGLICIAMDGGIDGIRGSHAIVSTTFCWSWLMTYWTIAARPSIQRHKGSG